MQTSVLSGEVTGGGRMVLSGSEHLGILSNLVVWGRGSGGGWGTLVRSCMNTHGSFGGGTGRGKDTSGKSLMDNETVEGREGGESEVCCDEEHGTGRGRGGRGSEDCEDADGRGRQDDSEEEFGGGAETEETIGPSSKFFDDRPKACSTVGN